MNKIICGDAIEEMKKLEENLVDAIITDPPYGLEFMGKEWDSFKQKGQGEGWQKAGKPSMKKFEGRNDWHSKSRPAFRGHTLEHWKQMQNFFYNFGIEAIRVLKPGGFMLIMGGTRTYHRMVCGIEDAGFEIRDKIEWIYGSGFPKSMDIGQDFDRQECRKQLTKKLGRKPTRDEFKEAWKNFRKIIGEIKRGDVQKAKEKGVGYLSDPANRNNKKQFGYGIEKITIPQTQEAKEWEGWGTALKPACESIVVARKPLSEKNVALNVLKWGTGGMNIDECRISLEREEQPTGSAKRVFKSNKYTDEKIYGDNKITPKQGRFPSNIILECICDKTEQGQEKISGGFGAMDIGISDTGKGITQKYDKTKSKSKENKFLIHTNPNCPCRMLDEQSEDLKSGSVKEGTIQGFSNKGANIYGDSNGVTTPRNASKGGASRFFYCAKASKSERNLGMDDKQPDRYEDGKPVRWNKAGVWTNDTTPAKNNHPTVKPIKLMEYLIKLVTLKGAIVCDPFGGSGTTAIACIKLGRIPILIEKEEEYVKIANARIKPFLEQEKLE